MVLSPALEDLRTAGRPIPPFCLVVVALVQAEGESPQENNLAEDELLFSLSGLVFGQTISLKFSR